MCEPSLVWSVTIWPAVPPVPRNRRVPSESTNTYFRAFEGPYVTMRPKLNVNPTYGQVFTALNVIALPCFAHNRELYASPIDNGSPRPGNVSIGTENSKLLPSGRTAPIRLESIARFGGAPTMFAGTVYNSSYRKSLLSSPPV